MLGLSLQRCQAQARHGLDLVFGGLLGDPGQAGLGGVELTLVELQPGQQKAALLCEGGGGEVLLQVGEDACGLVGVAGQAGPVELVEHRAGLQPLLALPVVPAVPGRKSTQHQHQQPGDEIAELVPERLEGVELFLLLQVEWCGHG